MTLLIAIIALGAAAFLLAAGYLYGVGQGRDARQKLRDQYQAQAEEIARLRDRTIRRQEDDPLRAAVQKILTPLMQRDQLSFELARIDGSKAPQRDLSALLDQFAQMGNCLAVLLSDEQGWPLAANSGARNLEKLGATASLLMLIADRMGRDGTPAPMLLTLHDATNIVTMSRLFHVDKQRLALTVVSAGGLVTPTAIDLVLAKLSTMLLNRERGGAAAEQGTARLP